MGRRSRERRRRRRVPPGGDRISELPVDVRIHILSFLTTKTAVQVGVVSKAWAGLWASSPNLLFHQKEFSSTEDFTKFVRTALNLRFGSCSKITRFELRCHHEFYNTWRHLWLYIWLYYVVLHGVRDVVVHPTPEVIDTPWFKFYQSICLNHSMVSDA